MDDGSVSVNLGDLEEVWTDFVPTRDDMGDFTDHFAHYMPYVEREVGAPELEPKQLTGIGRRPRAATPALGNSFAPRLWPYTVCYPFRVG
jgi:hypothetical protein